VGGGKARGGLREEQVTEGRGKEGQLMKSAPRKKKRYRRAKKGKKKKRVSKSSQGGWEVAQVERMNEWSKRGLLGTVKRRPNEKRERGRGEKKNWTHSERGPEPNQVRGFLNRER